MSEAMIYLKSLFGSLNIKESLYSAICSGQDEFVFNHTIAELKKENPTVRLVLTTSIAGMGFDPKKCNTSFTHGFPEICHNTCRRLGVVDNLHLQLYSILIVILEIIYQELRKTS